MKISICIPTWEQYGHGPSFLRKALDTIKCQTYKNFEVVVSDHSKDDCIKEVCLEYGYLPLVYVRYNEHYGNSPANTNNSIRYSSGEIIKVLFQDDFFFTCNALEKIVECFKDETCNWVVVGSNQTDDDGKTYKNYLIPRWNDRIPFGTNTISSPSVLAVRKGTEHYSFDENLTMMMDCEMYYRLYKQYGLPTVETCCLVTNREHGYQISAMYTGKVQMEIEYIQKKHSLK